MAIASATPSDIWSAGGELQYLSAAETMNITSTSADDTLAGTGARTVDITGLDGSHNEINETVELNGVANVLTSLSYLRVFSLETITAGSGLENAGDITAISSGASTTQCFMSVGTSISKNSQFTIPAGKRFVIIGAEMNATKLTGGQAPNIVISALFRRGAANSPWISAVNRRIDTSVVDQLIITQPVGQLIEEKSDLRFFAETNEDNTEARVRYYGVLIDI